MQHSFRLLKMFQHITILSYAHSIGMTGLFKQKEDEFKSLWEVGSRLAKFVLAQKWCSKMFLLPCWWCQCEQCLSENTVSSLETYWLGKATPFLPHHEVMMNCLVNLHLLSVCFNYIGQVKVQHGGGALSCFWHSSSSSWPCLLPIITKSLEKACSVHSSLCVWTSCRALWAAVLDGKGLCG